MATDLYAISNINTSKEEVLKLKDVYLKKLKGLNLGHTSFITADTTFLKSEGDWEYEFPELYDENGSILEDNETEEIIHFYSPFVFAVTVFPNCLIVSTIYKYRFLYEDEKPYFFERFRRNLFDIINIFGGTEIIYLADNACDKLGSYLECEVWEGVSYNTVKKDMVSKKIPFVSAYDKTSSKAMSYSNITEIVFDDFKDIFTVKLLEIGAEGGGFTLLKSKNNKKDDFYYYFTISEIKYDLEDVSIIREQPQKFTTFLEAFKMLKKKHKSLFQFYPLYINNEVKQDVLKCLNKEYLQKEKDGKFKIWEDQINF